MSISIILNPPLKKSPSTYTHVFIYFPFNSIDHVVLANGSEWC